MTIQYKEGDLLEEQVDAIVHQANLYHTFGGGIARVIAHRFPEVYDADKATPFGETTKLGTFSCAIVERPFGEQLIINMYSQEEMTQTKYSPMRTALQGIRALMEESHMGSIGIPHGMGCGLANGKWEDVEQIITDVFATSTILAVIVKLPPKEVRR